MRLLNLQNSQYYQAQIGRVRNTELIEFDKEDFIFDWEKEQNHEIFGIRIKESKTILGLVSVIDFKNELRLHINLLEVVKSQVGKLKTIKNIGGCLIAFVCKEAFKRGYSGFVSLIPKTELISHYEKYGFSKVGTHMVISSFESHKLILKYTDDE